MVDVWFMIRKFWFRMRPQQPAPGQSATVEKSCQGRTERHTNKNNDTPKNTTTSGLVRTSELQYGLENWAEENNCGRGSWHG